MSTAAPAGSATAPAAQPSPGGAAPAQAPGIAGGAKPPITVKPIPEPPRIKGKLADRGSLLHRQQLKELGVTLEGEDQGDGQLIRDAKRKLAQPGDPETAVIDKGEQAPEGDAQPQDLAPAAEFIFGGQKFKTQADAEAYFNRARANTSAVEKKLAKLTKEHSELAEVAQQWEGTFAELQRRGILGGNPNPPGNGQEGRPQERGGEQGQDQPQPGVVGNFVDSLPDAEWSKVEQMAKTHGVAVAMAHVSDHLDNHVRRMVGAALQQFQQQLAPHLQSIQPLVEQHTQVNNQTRAHQFWAQDVAKAADEGGAPIFPDLVNNPQGAREVSLFWLHLGKKFGRDVAFSPEGFRWAHSQWQSWKAKGQAATADAGKAAASVVARMNSDQRAATSQTVSGAGVPPGQDAPPASQEQQIKRSFKTGGGLQRVSSTGLKLGIL